MSGFRKDRPLRLFTWLFLLGAVAFAAGCSTANDAGGGSANHVLPSGSSVPGWTVPAGGSQHAISATQEFASAGTLGSCTECHGPDFRGGISRASCFGNSTGCHHGTIPGWAAAPPATQNHGVWAKRAIGDGSFFACQICHGSDFSGGGAQVTCFNNAACHGAGVLSPHPSTPWRGAGYTHTNTDPSNAPVCAQCHFPGSPNNPPNHPAAPAPAGTPPGCFNSTLCHGDAAAVPHPVGATWVTTPPAAQPHGNEAKGAPVSTTGFAYCQVCHGTGTTSPSNFGGGSSGVSCYPCHGGTHPHPDAPWRTSAGSTYNHTNTDTANAPVCAQCHFPGSPNNPPDHPPTPAPAGTLPGCFNSTLCHDGGSGAPHPVPFNDSAHFTETAATFPANCSACHDVSAPSVKSGPVCQTCHVAESPLTSLNCTSCHANPPDSGAPAGTAYPNIEGAHAEHIALNGAGTPISCDTCHNGLGSGTLNHYNAAKSRTPPGDAAFPATYAAQTGASAFDNSAALSCSNVSCHGGQATPNWQTGTLDVNAQCTICHVSGTTQFNSYNSGDHVFHVNVFGTSAFTCNLCHNSTSLAVNHFTALATPEMEGPASATIGGGSTLIPAGNYDPATQSCSPDAGICHGTRTW